MNILIIGLGSIAQKHIAAIRLICPKAIIYAFRSSKDAGNFPDIQNIYSLNELKTKLDFIIISNPTHMHERTIVESLKFDCPLFIEKPVLSDLKNVGKVIENINKAQVINYVACNMRFHPALQFLKDYLATNRRINEVNVYCGSYLPDWHRGKDFRTLYSAHAVMGGGVHLDLIHELDYCVWFFGMPVETFALKRSVSSLQIDAIDSANFNLLYSAFTVNITLNYFRRDPKREIEVVMEDDTLIVDLLKNKVYNSVSGDVLFENPFNIQETYVKQMQYFIHHVQENTETMNNMAESVETLKLALHG